MRKRLHQINEVMSWVLLILTFVFLVYTLLTVSNAAKTGEGAFVFGYRPVYVMTGSMEPYMMTNSICLTKQVDSLEDIDVGDVITFQVEGQSGKTLNITHRIVSIENGIINTKGDNNRVTDDLPLTIANVDAKVVAVFNQTAWVVEKWQTTSGKVMLISFSLAIVFAYWALKTLFKVCRNQCHKGDAASQANAATHGHKRRKRGRYERE